MEHHLHGTMERGIATFLFVAGRYATTSADLSKELGCGMRQARRYLRALERVTPLIVTTEEHPTSESKRGYMAYYKYSHQWRKEHGFL